MRTTETVREAFTPKPLYTLRELGRMTDSALEELLDYYSDRGDHTLAEEVQAVIEERQEDAEARWEAEQDRRQQLHDEWLASTFG